MTKSKSQILSVFFTLLISSSVFSQGTINGVDIKSMGAAMDKFSQALQTVNFFYMDTVNDNKLAEDAIVGMLEKLDPHSVYVTPKELKEFNEPLSGNFEGVGIQFNILEDTITVISPIAGGPSDRVGILSGDRIVRIDDENVAGIKIKNEQVMKRLRGNKGTQVRVGILRRGVKDVLDFTITRDKIPLYSVDASYLVKPGIGYIKLSRFAQTSTEEVRKGISNLKSLGAKDLILDLQDNGGGYLNTAYELADDFLSADKLIVYTNGVHAPRKDYTSTSAGMFEKGRLVVLVDEGSASASEILSGAVQDWDRGLVIGRRTFGKGLVQNQFPLQDGSALRLTIAQYFTPTGRCIQRPYGKGTEAYYKDLYNRYKHGELSNADSIKFPDSLKYKTPNGRTVYGGGGIMPDVFIPLDTTFNSKYFTDIARKGILNQFVLSYVDRNRKQMLSQYPNFEVFKAQFQVTDGLVGDLVAAAEKAGVKPDTEGLKTSDKVVRTQLKAFMARDLFKNENFYEVINELNDPLQRALKALDSGEEFKRLKLQE